MVSWRLAANLRPSGCWRQARISWLSWHSAQPTDLLTSSVADLNCSRWAHGDMAVPECMVAREKRPNERGRKLVTLFLYAEIYKIRVSSIRSCRLHKRLNALAENIMIFKSRLYFFEWFGLSDSPVIIYLKMLKWLSLLLSEQEIQGSNFRVFYRTCERGSVFNILPECLLLLRFLLN